METCLQSLSKVVVILHDIFMTNLFERIEYEFLNSISFYGKFAVKYNMSCETVNAAFL